MNETLLDISRQFWEAMELKLRIFRRADSLRPAKCQHIKNFRHTRR